jgi:hypothetical protein
VPARAVDTPPQLARSGVLPSDVLTQQRASPLPRHTLVTPLVFAMSPCTLRASCLPVPCCADGHPAAAPPSTEAAAELAGPALAFHSPPCSHLRFELTAGQGASYGLRRRLTRLNRQPDSAAASAFVDVATRGDGDGAGSCALELRRESTDTAPAQPSDGSWGEPQCATRPSTSQQHTGSHITIA